MSALLLLLVVACRGPDAPEPVALAPISAEGQSCEMCGMLVLEQPAPRGQVAHKGGEHAWLCSIADLRAYVQTPSPRGPVAAVWVEQVPETEEPAGFDPTPRPWRPASELTYVVGFERPHVMGRPALSLGSPAEAAAVAARLGARVATWQDLVATPFNQDPPKEEP